MTKYRFTQEQVDNPEEQVFETKEELHAFTQVVLAARCQELTWAYGKMTELHDRVFEAEGEVARLKALH
jgi:hypothetical protein